jgi:hypothetical protein
MGRAGAIDAVEQRFIDEELPFCQQFQVSTQDYHKVRRKTANSGFFKKVFKDF